MKRALVLAAVLTAGFATAQTTDDQIEGLGLEALTQNPLPSFPLDDTVLPLDQEDAVQEIETRIITEELVVPREEVDIAAGSADGAILRGLDKVSGDVTDLELGIGETGRVGRLSVNLGECRYPVNNPAGDAYAWLEITAEGIEEPQFKGWMVASSPALNPLDNPRYDVWVIRCKSS